MSISKYQQLSDSPSQRTIPQDIINSFTISKSPKHRLQEIKSQHDELFSQVLENLLYIGGNDVDLSDLKLTTKEQQSLPTFEETSDNPDPSLIEAVKSFYKFFRAYNSFFWGKVDTDKKAQISYQATIFIALKQTRDAWKQLSNAINQTHNPIYVKRLMALKKAGKKITDKLPPDLVISPIFYVDKFVHITRFPYQSPFIFGIPVTGDGDKIEVDQCSLAHEIGHAIFCNNGDLPEYKVRRDKLHSTIIQTLFGKGLILEPSSSTKKPEVNSMSQNEVDKKIAAYHAWDSWSEEIFADIVGALLTGPIYVKKMQDLLIRERILTDSYLIHDDEEHPVPLIRPHISLEVIKIIQKSINDKNLAENLKLCIEKLELRWSNYLKKEVNDGQFIANLKLNSLGTGSIKNITTQYLLDSSLKDIIRNIIEESQIITGDNQEVLTGLITQWNEKSKELTYQIEMILNEPVNKKPAKKINENLVGEYESESFTKLLLHMESMEEQPNRSVASSPSENILFMNILAIDSDIYEQAAWKLGQS